MLASLPSYMNTNTKSSFHEHISRENFTNSKAKSTPTNSETNGS